jgi:sulfate transport system permease protein
MSTTEAVTAGPERPLATSASRSGAPSRPSRRKGRVGGTPSGVLIRWATLGYLGVMVLLPLVALGLGAAELGPLAFWKALADPFAWHALKLTFATALVMVLINAVMGTATAWVLVRYPFPGKGIVNALIDLPFAVPTVVTGLMLVALYGPTSVLGAFFARNGFEVIYQKPGIVLALLFVTFPFVVRSVQPVLLELDPAEEEAALTLGAGPFVTFTRVTLPTLWPAIVTGTALSFSRALGEFGSVVMVAGNRPLETKTGPMYIFGEIESGNPHGAMVVSVTLLVVSLGILVALNRLQRRGGESADER